MSGWNSSKMGKMERLIPKVELKATLCTRPEKFNSILM